MKGEAETLNGNDLISRAGKWLLVVVCLLSIGVGTQFVTIFGIQPFGAFPEGRTNDCDNNYHLRLHSTVSSSMQWMIEARRNFNRPNSLPAFHPIAYKPYNSTVP